MSRRLRRRRREPIHDGYEMARSGARNPVPPGPSEPAAVLPRESLHKQCYADFLGQPLSERAHHLLHTDHHAWKCRGTVMS